MMNINNFIKLLTLIIIFSPYVSKAEIKPGEIAPEFTATDHDGKTVDIGNLKGKWVVLYFYPKDDTPGCTIEAKQFTELYEEFLKKDAVVYGVSTDTKESHCDFIDKYKLKVPLIPDEEHKIMSLYDVKVSNGFASRDTIVINPSGYLVKIYRNVKPAGHAREVLEFINQNSTLQN
ncbi:MAG TPA: peroxiredoxin [Thermodesulfobacteriota bacterium]|jgi:peroxiredoxin Q/BCP